MGRFELELSSVAQREGGSGPGHAHRFTPIGHIESCFVQKNGTPRQAGLAASALARLRVVSFFTNPRHALEGLEAFSHVWLLYEFHQNTNAAKTPQRMVRAKVHPPGLDGGRCGLFATRTPHRPCPIGLSVARLLEVRGDTLLLGRRELFGVGRVVRAARRPRGQAVAVDVAAPAQRGLAGVRPENPAVANPSPRRCSHSATSLRSRP